MSLKTLKLLAIVQCMVCPLLFSRGILSRLPSHTEVVHLLRAKHCSCLDSLVLPHILSLSEGFSFPRGLPRWKRLWIVHSVKSDTIVTISETKAELLYIITFRLRWLMTIQLRLYSANTRSNDMVNIDSSYGQWNPTLLAFMISQIRENGVL